MEVKTILKRLDNGDLNRDIDEKYNKGFWDLAGEFSKDNEQQTELYSIFYAIYEHKGS